MPSRSSSSYARLTVITLTSSSSARLRNDGSGEPAGEAAFAHFARQPLDDLLIQRARLRRRDGREREFPRGARPCTYCIYRIYTASQAGRCRTCIIRGGLNDADVATNRSPRARRDDGRLRPRQQAFRRLAGRRTETVVSRRHRPARYTENAGAFLGLGDNWSPAVQTAVFTVGTGLILCAMIAAAFRYRLSGPALVGLASTLRAARRTCSIAWCGEASSTS